MMNNTTQATLTAPRTRKTINAAIDAVWYVAIRVIAALAVMSLAYGIMLAEVELAKSEPITEPLPR
jgi:anti-sigma-K factor RskA